MEAQVCQDSERNVIPIAGSRARRAEVPQGQQFELPLGVRNAKEGYYTFQQTLRLLILHGGLLACLYGEIELT